MMFKEILDGRGVHAVRDIEEYRGAHLTALAKWRAHGRDLRPFEVDETVEAFVNHGMWKSWCPAQGCGNAPAPVNREARCFACGAIYRVTYPTPRAGIEKVLLRRSDPRNRNLEPGETLDDLEAENRAHGVGGS